MGPSLKQIQPHMHTYSCWCDVTSQEIEGWLASFDGMLVDAGFSVLKRDSASFPGGGITAFWVLAESHLAIHYFVEDGVAYLELTSCNEQKRNMFVEQMKSLQPREEFLRSSHALSQQKARL